MYVDESRNNDVSSAAAGAFGYGDYPPLERRLAAHNTHNTHALDAGYNLPSTSRWACHIYHRYLIYCTTFICCVVSYWRSVYPIAHDLMRSLSSGRRTLCTCRERTTWRWWAFTRCWAPPTHRAACPASWPASRRAMTSRTRTSPQRTLRSRVI